MKYKLKMFILIFITMLSCGCTKDIRCKNIYDDYIKYEVIVEADVIEGKVTNAKAVMKFDDEYGAYQICELNNLFNNDKVKITCDRKKVIITGYEFIEYDGNEDSITKDKFIENLENQGFNC